MLEQNHVPLSLYVLFTVLLDLFCFSAAPPAEELGLIRARRVDIVIGSLEHISNIPQWCVSSISSSLSVSDAVDRLSTLDETGKWPDVDYATGCAARRANWPAQLHWICLRKLYLLLLIFLALTAQK